MHVAGAHDIDDSYREASDTGKKFACGFYTCLVRLKKKVWSVKSESAIKMVLYRT